MNNKVSNYQICMLFILIMSSLYLGIGDIILLKISRNDALISMLLGLIIGIIPILMYLKINDYKPDNNIFEKNNILFGKKFGKIINTLFIILCFSFMIIIFRSMIMFIKNKYLDETPFYVIGLLILITSIILSCGKLEKLARVSAIMFILAVTLVIYIEISLASFIEIENIFPILSENSLNNILYGSIYYASLTSLTSFFLLSIKKNEVSNPKKYSKNFIIFYLIGSFSLIIVMFYVISSFGYELASIFKYPEYVILKKIIVSSADFHIENVLSFRWLFYMLSLINICIYSIKKYLEQTSLKNNFQIIIIFIIGITSLLLSKNLFPNDPSSIVLLEKFYIPLIAIPFFLLMLLIVIKILLRKNSSS